MINENYKHSELSGKIISAAMEVLKYLRNDFHEVIFQRALSKKQKSKSIKKSFKIIVQDNE